MLAGAENDAIGTGLTLIKLVRVDVDVQPLLDAVSVTEYKPVVAYTCAGATAPDKGLPSPKSQEYVVALLVVFVKVTLYGAQPKVSTVAKLTDGEELTVTDCVALAVQPELSVTVNVTV